MTINDQQVLDIINALLAKEGVRSHDRVSHLHSHRTSSAELRALGPLVERYLEIMDPPATCQALHDHWEGPMICGNRLPCPTHGGR